MEPWQTLVATALVGTGRQTPTAPEGEGNLKHLLDQLDWSQPEQSLLGAAGAIALHQQIGQQPAKKDWPTVEPCSLEDRRCIQMATARHLDTALSTYPEVLPELLSLIIEAGQRVPEWQLPRLLQMGYQTSELRPYIAAAVGKRGQWLAAQQPNWGYAQAGDANTFLSNSSQMQAVWQNGRRSDRVLVLQRWREADPNAARAALEAVWSTESAKDREAFIAVLQTNLTIADEPFLETALSDRAKSVRQIAVNLLVQLPRSRLCQRMAQRIQPLVQLSDEGDSLQIDVTLPSNYDPDWKRDGIQAEGRSPERQQGGWLEQIIAATPLDMWGDPVVAIRAISGHPQQAILMPGWGLAVHHQQRIDWADAVLNNPMSQLLDDVMVGQLLALLTPQRQERWLKARLPDNPNEEDITHWLLLLVQRLQPWDLAFSRLIFEQTMALANDSSRNAYSFTSEIRNLRLTLHPDIAAEVAIAVENYSNDANASRHWKRSLLALLKYLNFRREMHRVFQASE
ncbi:DUF5691 domain-containing protein [Vacuolonema iberomarrocanum]|uniref:DUF5691 domain-containing protein n=1 Tax=Vacuolonema iberomarrocanum TaxID=3454632 RepID=UPI0019E7C18C|nr:hypothetical protein [filamentous cyanobacterium LEGE 07170]